MVSGCFTIYALTVGGMKAFGILAVELMDEFDTTAARVAFIPALAIFLHYLLGE
jgi:hypothetical protein